MIITTDKDYQRNEIEQSKGEDFLVFRPFVFKVKSRDVIKERDFSELVQAALGTEHSYFHLNSNIGYLILNQNEEGFE